MILILKIGSEPNFDHTLGTDLGKYIFIKNNNNDGKDEVARLKSPTLASSNSKDKCIEFYYYMNGPNTLNLYKYYPSTQKSILAWRLMGEQGNTWLKATLPYTTETPFHFILEGSKN